MSIHPAPLEIIGPDPVHPADPGVAAPFGIDDLVQPRLATWADPVAVSGVLDALGVRLAVESGSPGLVALLDTPRGLFVLG